MGLFGQALNAALGAAFVFGCVVPAVADATVDSAVRILKTACVDPREPSQILKSAYDLAEREKWTLVAAGPAPLPFQPRPGEPDATDFAAWRVHLDGGGELGVRVQVVNPELMLKAEPKFADLVLNACAVFLPNEVEERASEAAIRAQFGATIVKDEQKAPSGEVLWHFVDRMAQGDCSRAISTGGMRRPTIDFLDVVLPPDEFGTRRPWLPCRTPGKQE